MAPPLGTNVNRIRIDSCIVDCEYRYLVIYRTYIWQNIDSLSVFSGVKTTPASTIALVLDLWFCKVSHKGFCQNSKKEDFPIFSPLYGFA